VTEAHKKYRVVDRGEFAAFIARAEADFRQQLAAQQSSAR
jgi:hypothetical protein